MATISVFTAADLGPVLRQARVSQDLTQSGLAELAGVGRQWLNAFEAGDKPAAPLDMMMRVIQALGVSVLLTPARSPHLRGRAPVEDDTVDLDELVDGTRR